MSWLDTIAKNQLNVKYKDLFLNSQLCCIYLYLSPYTMW